MNQISLGSNAHWDHFNGVPIFVTELATRLVGGRLHQYKVWMRHRCYARRIQKKWAKRYGAVNLAPQIFQARHPFTGAMVFYVHPSLMPKLREVANGSFVK